MRKQKNIIRQKKLNEKERETARKKDSEIKYNCSVSRRAASSVWAGAQANNSKNIKKHKLKYKGNENKKGCWEKIKEKVKREENKKMKKERYIKNHWKLNCIRLTITQGKSWTPQESPLPITVSPLVLK